MGVAMRRLSTVTLSAVLLACGGSSNDMEAVAGSGGGAGSSECETTCVSGTTRYADISCWCGSECPGVDEVRADFMGRVCAFEERGCGRVALGYAESGGRATYYFDEQTGQLIGAWGTGGDVFAGECSGYEAGQTQPRAIGLERSTSECTESVEQCRHDRSCGFFTGLPACD